MSLPERERRVPLLVAVLVVSALTATADEWALTNQPYRAMFTVPKIMEVSSYRQATASPSIAVVDLPAGQQLAGLQATSVRGRRARPLACKVAWQGRDKAWVAVNFRAYQSTRSFYVYYGSTDVPSGPAFPTNTPARPVEVIRHGTDTFTPPATLESMLHIFSSRAGTYSAEYASSLSFLKGTASSRRQKAKREIVSLRAYVVCPKDGTYLFGIRSANGGSLLVDGDLAVHSDGEASRNGWAASKCIELTAGPHLLQLYGLLPTAGSSIRAGWQLPGRATMASIPSGVLLSSRIGQLVRVDERGRKINPGFTSRRRDSYSFRGRDAVFVPVWLTSSMPATTNQLLSYSWDFGDGASGKGKNVHRYYRAGNRYTAKLTVSDVEGGSWDTSREVDLRNVVAKQKYPLAIELEGLPAVCYPDDKLEPYLQFTGRLPRYFNVQVEWTATMTDGRAKRRVETISAEGSSKVPPVSLFECEAGQVRSLDWAVTHHGVVLSSQRVEFVRPPFSRLPARASADCLYSKDGTRQVLVPDRWKPDTSSAVAAVAKDKVVWVDDFLVDSVETQHVEGTSVLLTPECVRFSLRNENKYASTALLKLVAISGVLEDKKGLVVISIGRTDIQLGTSMGAFERHIAAISEMVASRPGRSLVWISPPAYPSDRDMVRPYAAAVVKVALSHGVPAVDLYSPFMCENEHRRLLFGVTPMILSSRGLDLAHRVIDSELGKLGISNADAE